MAYDPISKRVMMFGGQLWPSSTCLADTWFWNSGTGVWVAGPSGPPARSHHGMATDPKRGKVVLFGGHWALGDRGDTWEYDGLTNTWTQVASSGPIPRRSFGMAYDSCCCRTAIHGGASSQPSGALVVLGDTWEWDGSTASWIQVGTAGPPRYFHSMVYDGACRQLLFFGGTDATRTTVGGTWTAPDPLTCTLCDSTGVNKDLENTTGSPADGVEIILQGSYPNVHHFDGYVQNYFNTFTITQRPDGNTSLRWTNPNNALPPGQIGHVGCYVPGVSISILGVSFLVGQNVNGCAHQVNTNTHYLGTPGGQIYYQNSCLQCERIPLYVKKPRIEWYAIQVPLGDLNPNGERHPMRVDSIPGPPVRLNPGEGLPVAAPQAPPGARFAVIVHQVSARPDLSHATTDFYEFETSDEQVPASVPNPGRIPDTEHLQLNNNPLRDGAVGIRFNLAREDFAAVRVFDVGGRLVRTLSAGRLGAGPHSMLWDGRDENGGHLPPGIYFVQVNRPLSGTAQAKQVILLK